MPEPPPPPVIPDDKVLLELKVVRMKYEAWWKNCLMVSVAGDTQNVACNKDVTAQTRYFLADKPPACNPVKVTISTFKNQGSKCSDAFRQGQNTCNGDYGSAPDWSRSASDSTGSPFYRAYDWNTISNSDPLIITDLLTAAVKQEMTSFRNGGRNRMIRVFYEDQPKENLDQGIANAARRDELGIDFNDYTFDVIGKDVKFFIEGSGPQGCAGQ